MLKKLVLAITLSFGFTATTAFAADADKDLKKEIFEDAKALVKSQDFKDVVKASKEGTTGDVLTKGLKLVKSDAAKSLREKIRARAKERSDKIAKETEELIGKVTDKDIQEISDSLELDLDKKFKDQIKEAKEKIKEHNSKESSTVAKN